MPVIDLHLDGDGCWPDLQRKFSSGTCQWYGAGNELVLGAAVLPRGMASGKPSVALRIDLPDGKTIVVETSYAAFMFAANAMRVRYGEPT